MTWEAFTARVAEIADIEPSQVHPESLLIRELGLDSLALTELVLVVIYDLGGEALANDILERSWETVSAGQLYDDACRIERASE
jgi:acyl carrier protein